MWTCRQNLLFIVLVIAITSTAVLAKPSHKANPEERSCEPEKLMVYRVSFLTHWSRTLFPKQYPEWRPPAQWSKLIGRSHDSSYVLFRVGHQSTDGFKEFAESGRSDTLDAQSQGLGGVLDEFNAPPITSGEGKTEAEFFVDTNHSRVSLAARIVPSPDWFVGLDSFNLCMDGQWVDSVAIKVGPADAGTDNGFTFTSPNWPTAPAEKIFRITSQVPDHPANSFYYPELKELPPIATFYFNKVKEYELSEVFDASTSPSYAEVSDDPGRLVEEGKMAKEKEIVAKDDDVVDQLNNETLRKKNKKNSKSGAGEKSSLLRSLVAEYSKDSRAKKNRRGRKSANLSRPRHCVVSEWSSWSPCSKSCGIGESTRTRKVVYHARRGGNPCPPLEEAKWCGSSRDCSHAYFDW